MNENNENYREQILRKIEIWNRTAENLIDKAEEKEKEAEEIKEQAHSVIKLIENANNFLSNLKNINTPEIEALIQTTSNNNIRKNVDNKVKTNLQEAVQKHLQPFGKGETATEIKNAIMQKGDNELSELLKNRNKSYIHNFLYNLVKKGVLEQKGKFFFNAKPS